MNVLRFAPSPTGPLHLGHAFSALTAHDRARAQGGTFLLRIEDTDRARSKPHWRAQIEDDLRWLGLTWDGPVLLQSSRRAAHLAAIEHLADAGLVYPCRCRRADIRAAVSAPQEGGPPLAGPDGIVYPGTCRNRPMSARQPEDALRLNMAKLVTHLPSDLSFRETGPDKAGTHPVDPKHLVQNVGDIVLGRRDTGDIAYHLAVVVDDTHQNVSEVTRGQDLFETTALHVALQSALGLPVPRYHHHRLIRDDAGKRLAKRDDARAIAKFREDGLSPESLRGMVGLA